MKTKVFFCSMLMLFSTLLFAQQSSVQSPNGITFPSFTAAQRDAQLTSSPDGTVIYNTTTNLLELRTGSIWKALALPVCFTETISPTSTTAYKLTSGNFSTTTDITPSIPVANVSNVIVYGLPAGVTSATVAASPVYHVNLSVTPSSVVGSYPISIMSSSNCGLSNVSTFNLNIANCNFTNCAGNCVNTQTDVNNCGFCGNVVTVANGVGGCAAGAAFIVSCNAGFANCDGNAANGCEVNLMNNANNCGFCGNVINIANGVGGCVGGAAVVTSCNAGFANCDGNATNGCEVNVNTNVNNCGTCGHACPSGHSCINGVCN